MKKILVATDFSERSDRAVRRATLLANKTDASILLVHVVDDDQPAQAIESAREVAAQLLREQTKTLNDMDGVASNARVIVAAPSVGIVQVAEEIAPDLLVIGQSRRQPLRDSFVGTTAERIIRSVPCPVLMAKAPPVGPYRAILLAADLSEGCRMAIESFAALGIADDASVSALYVFDAPASGLAMSRMMANDTMDRHLRQEHKNAERALGHFMEALNVRVTERLVQRDGATPATYILKVAEQTVAGLIVVGTRGRSGLAKLLLGSVAEEILRNAEADVLAVPPKR